MSRLDQIESEAFLKNAFPEEGWALIQPSGGLRMLSIDQMRPLSIEETRVTS